jgi:hypothetical protein
MHAKIDYVNRAAHALRVPLGTVAPRSASANSRTRELSRCRPRASARRTRLQRLQVFQDVLGSALTHELLGGLEPEG